MCFCVCVFVRGIMVFGVVGAVVVVLTVMGDVSNPVVIVQM